MSITRADALRLHRAFCRGCSSCENAAEALKEAREEPLDEGEIQGRENAYERGMGL